MQNLHRISCLTLMGIISITQTYASPLTLIRSNYDVGEITRLCKNAIDTTDQQLKKLASKAGSQDQKDTSALLTFENTLAGFSDQLSPLTFMGYVSTDKDLAKEGMACEEKMGQFAVEIFTRKNLYQLLKKQTPANSDQKRLLEETLKSFEANGLKLSDHKLAEVKKLKKQLSVLEAKFSAHLNQDKTHILVTEAELEGVPEDYRSDLKKEPNGKFRVGTRRSDYSVFYKTAKSESVRKRWLFAYENRQANQNTALLESAILLRQKIAKLMGYSNWFDYQTDGRMAKNAKSVKLFLDQLRPQLLKKNQKDLEILLAYKKKLDPEATELKNWDINYLDYQYRKSELNLDEEKIREYFPVSQVIEGMFEVYSKLLSIELIEVKDANTWHPSVRLYRIEDQDQPGEAIAYFFMDLFPRDGKYGHAAAFPLISGRTLSNGKYSVPVASIVSNFAPPSNGKPSLLSHDEVETLFHEFGHIMHQTLTRAPFSSLSGTSTSQDFVEAPSQMLENWVWDKDILKLISGHYQDSSQKLPQETLNQMLKARDFNQGYFYTRQLLFASFDYYLHTATGPVHTADTYSQLFERLIGVPAIQGGHFPATFGHLMGGYDAGYYGYLWSEVYAEDMFTRFEKSGLLSAKTGKEYRRWILESGNMQDAYALIKAFLGRVPNQKAFLKRLGITSSR